MWPLDDPNYMRKLRETNRVRLLLAGSSGILLCILLLAFPDITPIISPLVPFGLGAFGIVVLSAGLWSIRKNNWRIREPDTDNAKTR